MRFNSGEWIEKLKPNRERPATANKQRSSEEIDDESGQREEMENFFFSYVVQQTECIFFHGIFADFQAAYISDTRNPSGCMSGEIFNKP